MNALVNLRNLKRFRDRHGKRRVYYRGAGGKLIPLPAEDDPGFLAAYQAAREAGEVRPPIGADRVKAGTIAALIVLYLTSPEWAKLAASTKKSTRRILDKLRQAHGHRPVATMQIDHVRTLVRERQDAPAAANKLLKVLRALMRLAVDSNWRRDDPTREARPIAYKTAEIATWSEEDIGRFVARWPLGTREHLALSLLLYTGQRQSDVVRLGPQHIRDGRVELRQSKTGTDVSVPVHAALTEAIAAAPSGHAVFLATAEGKPFTVQGLGNWLRDARAAAGMAPSMSPHGLRKAACRRLAEAGCSALEIQAISGHRSLRELEGYVRDVDRQRLADAAMKRLANQPPRAE
jgi:site-specific recombinase XerD